MPQDHLGFNSGATYRIPELDDPPDIEVAFQQFSDSIPAAPAEITTVTVQGDVTLTERNTLYVFEGSAPATLSLFPGLRDGDKIQILQLQNDPVTVDLNGIAYQGPTATTGQFSALTLLWQETEQRWVGSPFFSSLVLPPESQGGDETIDYQGRRYHIYRTPGLSFFYAHRDMLVNVYLVGPGGRGADAGTLPGDGGHGGQVKNVIGQHVDLMQSYPVTVGAPGGPSGFHQETAWQGPDGVVDTPTTVDAPMALPADLAAVLGYTEVGGSGPADSGPVVPATYGRGGGGAHVLIAPITRPSHQVSTPGSPGTPDYWIVTKPAWSEQVLSHYETVTIRGDGCAGTYKDTCPPPWYCVQAGQAVNWCEVQVQEPRYTTVNHPEEGYWGGGTPGSPGGTATVWDPCPSGYKVGGDTTKCVDARGFGPGDGGDGLVVIHYPHP